MRRRAKCTRGRDGTTEWEDGDKKREEERWMRAGEINMRKKNHAVELLVGPPRRGVLFTLPYGEKAPSSKVELF